MSTFNGATYCQVSDVITALTSFNSSGTPGDISSDIIQLAIDQASARVSSWTGQQWNVDGSGNVIEPPDMIASLTLDIATYYATLSYRKNKPMAPEDPVLLRYQNAMADLKSIQEGMIDPSPQQPNMPISAPGRVINTNPPSFTPYDSGTTLRRGRVEADTYPAPGTLGYI